MYFLPITPVAKGRPRFTRNGGCYTPAKTREYEEAIAAFAMPLFPSPLCGPLRLDVVFYLHRPKALKKTDKPAWHTKKPDLDNLIKAVKDALNGIAWIDDSQVCQIRAEKFYAPLGCVPGVAFVVEVIDAP